MIILLDAYNILKQHQPTRDIGEAQRRAFIDRVATYAHLREHTIFVVFDGGSGRFPSKSYVNPITVIYSGIEQSADDVLKRLSVEYAHKQTMLVSSDRQLCSSVQSQGVVCLDADVWESVLAGARDVLATALPTKSGEQAHKRAGYESSAELDALMQRASEQMMVKDEQGGFAARRVPAKQTLSKEEKKIQKLVKKL